MADMAGNKIFAVDFDGTLSQGVPFPEIGEANEPLFDMLIREKEKGSRPTHKNPFVLRQSKQRP